MVSSKFGMRKILAIFCSARFQEEKSCPVLTASLQQYHPLAGGKTYKEVQEISVFIKSYKCGEGPKFFMLRVVRNF